MATIMPTGFTIQGAESAMRLITEWLPDETLFSLCSRYHLISGNIKHSSTCQRLFGHHQRGSQHDMPSRIDEFVKRTSNLLGTSEHIIYNHTIIPYYLPLRSEKTAQEVLSLMKGDQIGSLKYQLGLLTSRFRANHPLKACSQCLSEDQNEFGVSYWHLEHQLPGVWLCTKHLKILGECTLKSNGINRFSWVLPHENILRTPANVEGSSTRDKLLKLSHNAAFLSKITSDYRFDLCHLPEVYRHQAISIGCTRRSGEFDQRSLALKIYDFCRQINNIHELSALPSSAEQAECQISGLLRPPRTSTHPIRHLTVISCLFNTWDDFTKLYQQLKEEHTPQKRTHTHSCRTAEHDHKMTEEVVKIISEGHSYREIAKALDVDTSTAMAWSAVLGVQPRTRPKKLIPSIRALVIERLRRGEEKSDVAKAYELSIHTLAKLLRSEPGLHQAWREAHYEKIRDGARSKWINSAQINPSLGCKQLRAIEPAAYAWLYRNDRRWLNTEGRLVSIKPKTNNSHVDWPAHDTEMALKVRIAATDIFKSTRKEKITERDIYLHIPNLRVKVNKRDRYPLTIAVMNDVINSSK